MSREVRRYGAWAGDPQGRPEDPARCVKEVWPGDRAGIPYQCLRNRGHGKGGLYCTQHAGNEARRLSRNKAMAKRELENDAIQREAARLGKLLGVEVVAQYNGFAKPPGYVEMGVISFEDLRVLAKRLKGDSQ